MSDDELLNLIPPGQRANLAAFEARTNRLDRYGPVAWDLVLRDLAAFTLRLPRDPHRLLSALARMNNDGRMWLDCARVMEYAMEDYAVWAAACASVWSGPIDAAMGHIGKGVLQGEENDPTSGLPHRGHVACNTLMQLWLHSEYPGEGA